MAGRPKLEDGEGFAEKTLVRLRPGTIERIQDATDESVAAFIRRAIDRALGDEAPPPAPKPQRAARPVASPCPPPPAIHGLVRASELQIDPDPYERPFVNRLDKKAFADSTRSQVKKRGGFF